MTNTTTKRARKSNKVVALAVDSIIASDVAAIIESLDSVDAIVTDNSANDTVTFRSVALAFDDATVSDAVQSLHDSFARRDTFEAAQGCCIISDNSYTRERNRMFKSEVAIARFFLALGVTASDVVERKVASNSMFNAKALKKITELAQYAVGVGARLEKVTRAFIACALVATDRGATAITNETNRRFLGSKGFTDLFSDAELIDYLNEQAHSAMTSGAETQSSQARNVLDVLRLGSIVSVNKSRDAVKLDASHSLFAQFRADFMKPLAVSATA